MPVYALGSHCSFQRICSRGLKALKDEHGTPEAESIRRAIAAYLAEKGVKPTQKGGRRPKKRK